MTRKAVPWRERTLSVLDAQRDESCIRQLTQACDRGSIFGRGSARTWQEAYEGSYLALENQSPEGPGAEALRRAVKNSLSKELPLISIREEMLLQRLIIFGGSFPVIDPDEYPAALSLVRRLWCTVRQVNQGTFMISLHESLGGRIASIMQTPEYHERRQNLFTLSATLHSLLYLSGFYFAQTMIGQLMREHQDVFSEKEKLYLMRFLMVEFDYLWNGQRELVLLHPGLCCPEEVISAMSGLSFQEPHFTHQMILDGMREMLQEERPAVDALRAELEGALQPEYSAEDTVNELKLLVKQGAGFEDLRAILADQMATAFHPGILAALRRLEAETVRWAGVSHGVLN